MTNQFFKLYVFELNSPFRFKRSRLICSGQDPLTKAIVNSGFLTKAWQEANREARK